MNDMKELLVMAISYFSRFMSIVILVRIILSWIPSLRENIIGQLVYSVTEPVLAPVRNMIAKSPLGGPGMMLDFSPIIASIGIEIASNILISIIIAL